MKMKLFFFVLRYLRCKNHLILKDHSFTSYFDHTENCLLLL